MSIIKFLGILIILVVPTLAAEQQDDNDMRVEAVFLGVKKDPGKDEYSILADMTNKTKENLPKIVQERANKLTLKYCGDPRGLERRVHWIAQEYGPKFGVTNETVPDFDTYDVAQRVILVYQNADPEKFPSVNASLVECEQIANSEHSKAPKKQKPFWILTCMAKRRRMESDAHSEMSLLRRWAVTEAVDAYLRDVYDAFACPTNAVEIARIQISQEYQLDGARKAAAAGKITQERLDKLVAANPLSNNAEYKISLTREKLERIRRYDEESKRLYEMGRKDKNKEL